MIMMNNTPIKTEQELLAAEDRLYNFRPAFFVAVFLCLGIVFAYLQLFNGFSAWWLLCSIPLAITPFFFCRSKIRAKKTLLALLALLVAFGVGNTFFRITVSDFRACGEYHGVSAHVSGRVIDISEQGAVCVVTLTDVRVEKNKEQGKLNAYLPASFCENLRLSDEIFIKGTLSTDTEYFDVYGFRAYEIKEKLRFVLKDAEDCYVTGHTFDLFLAIRERVEEVVYAGMDEISASVTMGVLLGETSGIEKGLIDNIRAGGIAHIFAVSGLHVGALFAFFLLILTKTKLKNLPELAKFLFMATLLIFYAGICGFSSSVLRATVLCLVGYGWKLLGLQADSLQSLGISAVLIVLFSPTALFEIGFQLSFLACLGILLLSRTFVQWLTRFCSFVADTCRRLFRLPAKSKPTEEEDTHPLTIPQRIARAVISFLSVTTAAQIATAPLLLKTFGYLSGWTMLLNCLFVPLVSVAFSFLLLFVALACVLPTPVGVVILYLPSVLWSAVLLLFQITDFSTFAFTDVTLSGGATLAYYAGWQFLSDKWNVTKGQRTFLAGTCFVALGVFFVVLLL